VPEDEAEVLDWLCERCVIEIVEMDLVVFGKNAERKHIGVIGQRIHSAQKADKKKQFHVVVVLLVLNTLLNSKISICIH
jgi:hypothetical protein